MSGGHFDYMQYHLQEIAESIKDVIDKNYVEVLDGEHDSWDYDENGNLHEWAKYHYAYSPEVIKQFKKGYEIIMKAYVYAQRIDWLLSGDDGEETFLKRLKEDLEELKIMNDNDTDID